MKIKIIVPGPPQGKGRHRTGRGRTYTPQKTRDYEELISQLALFAMMSRKPIGGPVYAHLTAVMPIPMSWPKKKKAKALSGEIRPTVKPDSDNIEKVAYDSLNGIVYGDDKQIVDWGGTKIYGEEPKLIIRIESI